MPEVQMSIAVIPSRKDTSQEFEELFREHFQFVYCTAYTVTGSRQDAEDVVQTIFLRLIRREISPALRQSPKAYLYRAAINESLNIVRFRKRHESLKDTGRLESLPVSSVDDSDDELQRSLVDAMAQLNPFSLEILILRYEHNHSDAEIAKMLGKSRGTIAVTLFRARSRLKKLLRAALGDKL
jgi:RNA polymerase sigma-70 factor (ECF subfamily)